MAKEEVKVFKASDDLTKKAGTGKIDSERLNDAEQALEESGFDFVAFAKDNLKMLKDEITKAKKGEINQENIREALTAPVMQLRSSAATYEYDLVGELTGIMCSFLETIEDVDAPALAIVEAHHTTLFAIISNGIKGNGGTDGAMLKKELMEVCAKYKAQKKKQQQKQA